MSEREPRTVELRTDQSAFVDDLIESGQYDSANDVVAAGLEALKTEKDAVERWLTDEVVPVAKALAVDPTRALPAQTAFAELKARYASDGGER